MKNLWLVVSGIIALGGAAAHACSCAPPAGVAEELSKRNTVLQGTVENIRIVKGQHGFDQALVKFKIEQSWKGISAYHPTMVLRTAVHGASCGYQFKKGQSYVVYGDLTPDGELSTSLCTRNALTANAAGDLAELGEGTKPQ